MAFLKIGSKDISPWVRDLSVTHQTIVGDDSGRDAKGNMAITWIAEKASVKCTLRTMLESDAKSILSLLVGSENKYVVGLTYRDPVTGTLHTGDFYHGDIITDYYTIQSNVVLVKEIQLEFIEV